MAEQFAALGVAVDPNEIHEDVFEVWDVNMYAFGTFLDLATQWRAAGTMAGIVWLGLDYAAVLAVLTARPREIMRRHPTASVFADLQVMEAEALEFRNGHLKK